LAGFPLVDRKEALAKLIRGPELIQLAETFNDPIALLRAAEEYGLEGIASKRTDLPYRSGRCIHWQKVKTAVWQEANKHRGELFRRKHSLVSVRNRTYF
jgi:bifunctional non-homologous end joining protein LigD